MICVLVKIGIFLSGFVNHMERGHLSQHKSSETNPRSESDKSKSELVVGLRSESITMPTLAALREVEQMHIPAPCEAVEMVEAVKSSLVGLGVKTTLETHMLSHQWQEDDLDSGNGVEEDEHGMALEERDGESPSRLNYESFTDKDY
jgi:hypothetical protein